MDGRNPDQTPNAPALYARVSKAPAECEFCGTPHVVMVLADHPRMMEEKGACDIYAACPNCLMMLVNHALAPHQYMRAKDAGGNTDRYYLHKDFYTDLGVALNPFLPAQPQCGGQVTGVATMDRLVRAYIRTFHAYDTDVENAAKAQAHMQAENALLAHLAEYTAPRTDDRLGGLCTIYYATVVDVPGWPNGDSRVEPLCVEGEEPLGREPDLCCEVMKAQYNQGVRVQGGHDGAIPFLVPSVSHPDHAFRLEHCPFCGAKVEFRKHLDVKVVKTLVETPRYDHHYEVAHRE